VGRQTRRCEEFALALSEAFALDDGAYRTMAARARHFAEYMFSPHSVATATHAVYTAVLERDLSNCRGARRGHGPAERR